jgi:hypothetical protein
MDYRVASNIRGKSLSSLMTDKITSGKGIGSALGGAISDKLKAKATGVKEKFDPMNIAKFMTGGSRLAPAIMGRLTGRSQSDINYFAGDKGKKGNYTQIPTSMATPGEGLGGSAVEVLNKMLSFMQRSREEDLKKKETAKQFIEEQKNEEQRRHKEFLEILREYTSLSGPTTLVKKEEGGNFLSGFMDTVKAMISSAIEGVKAMFNTALKAYEWIKDLKLLSTLAPYAARLATFLAGPVGLALLGAVSLAAFLYNANKEKEEIEKDPYAEKYKDNPYAMKLRGEAKSIGQATEINRNKATRQFRRSEIVEYVKSDLTDAELVSSPGAPGADRPTLKKWLDENPKPSAMFQGSVAALAGQPETAIPAGGKPLVKMPLPEGVEPSTAGGGRGSVNPPMVKPEETSAPATQTPVTPTQTTTPIPQTPMSSRMNDAIQENQDLSVAPPGNTQTPPPVLTTNTSTVDLPDRPIPATASVRDKTPILDHVLQQSLVPV